MRNYKHCLSDQVHRASLIAGVVILLAGCASYPPPLEQIAVSRAAVSSASSAGANEFAPREMKSATEKMEGVEQAMKDKKYELALQLAEQAQVDAQLASAVARSAKAKKAAEAVQEDSRILRQEIERKTK